MKTKARTDRDIALRMAARLPMAVNTVRLKAIAAQARAHGILRARRAEVATTLTREFSAFALQSPRLPRVAPLSAAKDIGDAKGDKKRGAAVAALLKAAEHLLEDEAWAAVPDIAKAAEAVLSAGELVKKMTETARKLNAMKTGAPEVVTAQKELDELRGHVDAMLPGASAALATLNKQGEKVVNAIGDIAALKAALAEAERVNTLEGVRLKAASQAVINSLMLG